MKYNKIKKAIDDVKDIKMSSHEKNDLLNHLDLYVKKNPIKVVSSERSLFQFVFVQTRVHKYAYYSIAFILIFTLIGGNVMYAAEKALPGDVLYPVKIHVNEKVKSAVALTPKAKAKIEEKRVIKRLDEVQTLVKTGKFDNQKLDQIEKEVEKSVKAIKINKKKDRKDIVDNNKIENGIKIIKTIDDNDDKDFKNKLGNKLEEIKKIDDDKVANKQHNEIEKLEEKIMIQLNGDNGDDRNKDHGGKDIKLNIGL